MRSSFPQLSHPGLCRKALVLLVLLLVCSGCSREPIAQDLSQGQAYEIISVLNDSGIEAVAARDRGGKARYTVSVVSDDYAQSVSILHKNSLPSEQRQSFRELVTAQGLMPNSREVESLRVDRAMAAEIEELLAAHPAVANVRVVVRSVGGKTNTSMMSLPSTFSLAPASESSPTVSVVLQKRPAAELSAAEVENVVLKTVPGVAREGISIAMGTLSSNNADEMAKKSLQNRFVPFLMYWKVPREQYSSLALTLLGGLVMIGGVGAILGYWWGYYHQAKVLFETDLPMVAPARSAAIRTSVYPGSVVSGGAVVPGVEKPRDRDSGKTG